MKKAILLSLLFVACAFTASAQKFALIDMEYILKNIPAYEQANNQLNQASQQYQAEIEVELAATILAVMSPTIRMVCFSRAGQAHSGS